MDIVMQIAAKTGNGQHSSDWTETPPVNDSLHYHLELTASTCIKRKKPWPRLGFLAGSVFLLDDQRISVLYMNTGKTKKKIPKLNSLVSTCLLYTYSANGEFIGGLMSSGDIFLWHKFSDSLCHIKGMPDIVSLPAHSNRGSSIPIEKPYMCISGKGCIILITTPGSGVVYIWELDPQQTLFQVKQTHVQGSWSRVTDPAGSVDILLGDGRRQNGGRISGYSNMTSVHAAFSINNNSLGLHCLCSQVYLNSEGDAQVTTVLLRWLSQRDIQTYSNPTFTADWKTISFSLNSIGPLMQPVREPGSFVVRQSSDGQLVAVAVNQTNTQMNRIVYVSVLPEVLTVCSLKGMGTRFPITEPNAARSHWIVDMSWTYDDLFLVCITGQGSVCMLTRLGEPVLLQVTGRGIEMGPKYFLPLHPLIAVSGSKYSGVTSMNDPMRQKFSVAVHPNLNLILCSDGFTVSALEVIQEVTTLTLMRRLVELSNARLRYIRSQKKFRFSLFDSVRRGAVQTTLSTSKRQSKRRTPYRFEATPNDAVDASIDTAPVTSPIVDADSGQVIFGDADSMLTTQDLSRFAALKRAGTGAWNGLSCAELIAIAYGELLHAWGLAASYFGIWTVEHEDCANNITHNLIKIFTIILSSDDGTVVSSADNATSVVNDGGLGRVLTLFKRVLNVACMDASGSKLMVRCLAFVHSTIELLLRSFGGSTTSKRSSTTLANMRQQKDQVQNGTRSRIRTLNGCYVLLRYSEKLLGGIYTVQHTKGSEICARYLESYTPRSRGSGNEQWHDDASQEGNSTQSYQELADCNGRLFNKFGSTWLLLHRAVMRYYNAVMRLGDIEGGKDADVGRGKGKRRSKQGQATSGRHVRQASRLVDLIVARLTELKVPRPFQRSCAIPPGEKLSVDGNTESSLEAWTEAILNYTDDELMSDRLTRTLHAILYTFLTQYDLRGAIQLVELLLRCSDIRQAVRGIYETDDWNKLSLDDLPKTCVTGPNGSPICITDWSAVRHVTRSVGRIMAAYFAINMSLFVYPPHHPLKIPPLQCTGLNSGKCQLPLSRDEMTAAIRGQELSSVWTVERALQYLLVGGLVADSVFFVHCLGDWKAAFTISAVITDYQREQTARNHMTEIRNKLKPQDHLDAEILLKDYVLKSIDVISMRGDWSESSHMTTSLSSCLRAATVCGFDITVSLLNTLLLRARKAVQQCDVLVPDSVYLPAPPVYCPQPVLSDEAMAELSSSASHEVTMRHTVSTLVRLILVVMGASRVIAPTAQWYARRVLKALRLAMGKQQYEECRADYQSIELYAGTRSFFEGNETDRSVHFVLKCFRDLIALVWCLTARDQLSLALREKRRESEKMIHRTAIASEANFHSLCRRAIHHAISLQQFSQFLQASEAENQLHFTLLSLVNELPRDEKTASSLAELFPDIDALHPTFADRVRGLLKDWQGIFLDEAGNEDEGGEAEAEGKDRRASRPDGLTMALCYHKYTQVRSIASKRVERMARLFKVFHEQVFCEDDDKKDEALVVGSRPFESDSSFAIFLDTFYDICVGRTLNDSESSVTPTRPLLCAFSDDIRNAEFTALSARIAARKMTQPYDFVQPFDVSMFSSNLDNSPRVKMASVRTPSAPFVKSSGLFRSISVGNVMGEGRSITRRNASLYNMHASSTMSVNKGDWPEYESQRQLRRPRDLRRSVSVASSDNYNYNNNNNNSNKRRLSVDHVGRCLSTSSLQSNPDRLTFDPLTEPTVSGRQLAAMKFTGGFSKLEQLADWLGLWAETVNPLDDMTGGVRNGRSQGQAEPRSAIKVKLSPKLLTYSLWLIDNWEDASMAQSLKRPSRNMTTVTVAPVLSSRHFNQSGPVQKNSKQRLNAVQEPLDEELSEDLSRRSNRQKKVGDSESLVSLSRRTSDLSSMPPERVDRKQSIKSEGGDSESSLNVSSLGDEDLQRTMKETLANLAKTATINADSAEAMPCAPSSANQSAAPSRSESRSSRKKHSARRRSEQSSSARGDDVGNLSDLSQLLQRAVRYEMRKMMEAQQQGIMSVLDAMDDTQNSSIKPRSTHESKRNKHRTTNDDPLDKTDRSNLSSHQLSYSVPPSMDNRPVYAPRSTNNDSPRRHKQRKQKNNGDEPDTYESVTPISSDVNITSEAQNSPRHGDGRGRNVDQLHVSQLHYLSPDRRNTPGTQFFNSGSRQNQMVLPLTELNQLTRAHEGVPTAWPLLSAPPPPPGSQRYGNKENQSVNSGDAPKRYTDVLHVLKKMNGHLLHANAPCAGVGAEHFLRIVSEPAGQADMYPVKLPKVRTNAWESDSPNFAPGERQRIPERLAGIHPTAQSIQKPMLSHNGRYFSGGLPFPLLRLHDNVRDVRGEDPGLRSARRDASDDLQSGRGRKPEREQDVYVEESSSDKDASPRQHTQSTRNKPTVVSAPAEADTARSSPTKLHLGYALTPGLFDDYLGAQTELGSAADTNARVQFNAAMAMQAASQRAAQQKNNNKMADAATSINADVLQDADADAVSEAIRRYREEEFGQQRLGGPSRLPPDVFAQLRFHDNTGTLNNADSAGARSYLNVVDIQWSALADIVSSVPGNRQPISGAPDNGKVPQTMSETDLSNDDGHGKSDQVTERLLRKNDVSHSPPTRLMVDNILQRANAISEIAENMERELQSAHLLIDTIDDIGEVLDPSGDHKVQDDQPRAHRSDSQPLSSRSQRSDRSRNNRLSPGRVGQGENVTGLDEETMDLFEYSSPRQSGISTARGGENQMSARGLSEYNREQLRDWMETKRSERQKQYLSELNRTRSLERRPYQSMKDRPMKRTVATSEEERRARLIQHVAQRTQLADELLNNMLTEEPELPPPIPQTLSARIPRVKYNASGRFGGRKVRVGWVSDRTRSKSVGWKGANAGDNHMEGEFYLSGKNDNKMMFTEPSRGASNRETSPGRAHESGSVSSGRVAVKPSVIYTKKPFTELVRLQKPTAGRGITRKAASLQRPHSADAAAARQLINYGGGNETDRGATFSKPTDRTQTLNINGLSLQEKQRIYGSTHIPGSQKAPGARRVPRSVMTYRDRMNAMKQSQAGSSPFKLTVLSSRPGSARRLPSSGNTSGRQQRPMHKPSTYAERLKESKYQMNVTYNSADGPGYSRSGGAPSRSQLQRPRPYADPYSPTWDNNGGRRHDEDRDAGGVLGSWKIDDDVRRILYGDGGQERDRNAGYGKDGQPNLHSSPSLSDLIAFGEDAEGLDYHDEVNVDDLASMSGVSLTSFIDWDQVDELVGVIE